MTGKEIPDQRHPYRPSFGSPAVAYLKENLQYEFCLTVEDVEKASGLNGVNKVQHHPSKFMGGDLNFVNERGEKILCVVFATANQFEMFKSSMAEGMMTLAAGVGDEAVAGLSSSNPASQFLVFRQGGHAAFLIAPTTTSHPNVRLTLSQLLAIGKIITSRLV